MREKGTEKGICRGRRGRARGREIVVGVKEGKKGTDWGGGELDSTRFG